MTELGFIGLGTMGQPMARHLYAQGEPVCVYDLNPLAVAELVAAGTTAGASSREVAAKADVIFIIVPDTPDVENVLFGKDGVSAGIRPGTIVVDMSSISPLATREFARRLGERGVTMLDAPVSGSRIAAETATLSIMVGGPADTFARVKPYLEMMGKSVVHIGPNHGDGQICKVANQIIVGLTIEAISEALTFVTRLGANPSRVREAILGGFAQSHILDLCGQRMISRDFEPGFRVCHQWKDLKIALETARNSGIELPATSLTRNLYDAIVAQGGSELDHSAVVIALEDL